MSSQARAGEEVVVGIVEPSAAVARLDRSAPSYTDSAFPELAFFSPRKRTPSSRASASIS